MTTRSLNLARPRPLVVEEQPPRVSRPVSPNHWFLDFARAAFGTIRLTFRAKGATKVEVALGEKLNDDARIDREPPGCVRFRAVTLDIGSGTQTVRVEIPPDERNTGSHAIHVPSHLFEVMPFRYAEVTVPVDSGVELVESVRLAMFYPFGDSAACFRCDDDRLNQVWELCKYSIKATSFLGVYVDGDRERIPYEADAYINQLCHYGVDAEYELARHTIEYLLFHPTWPTEWSLHCLPMAWADYEYTGRTDLLEAYADVLERKALRDLAREDGLISTETGRVTPDLLAGLFLDRPLKDIVDWPPGSFTDGGTGERDGYDMVPVKTAVNAFYIWNLRLLERTSRLLGNTDAARYAEEASRATDALWHTCFSKERGIFLDGEGSDHASLHANMLPAAFGLLPPGAEASVTALIRSRGMACSVYGAQYLLDACYRLGDAAHALDLMTAEHDRGWLNMIRAGSTVTLEAWDHRYKNNLDWNHAWGAVPANIIPRFVAGVRPATPGFEAVLVAPRLGHLLQISAVVPTPRGPVSIEVEKSADKGRLLVDTPVPVVFDLEGAATTMDTTVPAPPGRHERFF